MIGDRPPWEELERRGPDCVEVGGVSVRAGTSVRLAPRHTGGDIFESALAGRTAVVHEVLQDYEGRIQLAVIVTDDPGQELGQMRRLGHRFFFGPDEVVPLDAALGAVSPPVRILIAGIGNVFLGDDGWGVALAGRLEERALPAGVEVGDFGIRGLDLAYAIQDGYEAVVLLDATSRGQRPGTLYLIEPELEQADTAVDAHGMDPVKVLALAGALHDQTSPDGVAPDAARPDQRRPSRPPSRSGPLPRTLIVGCEPQIRISPDEERIVVELSEPVRAALEPAAELVEELLDQLTKTVEQRKESRR